ncbi:winged helix-turn-helix domain-containing protein [Streptomyces sp. NPDC054884]|uniref:winged helix-turn-helix domain-containing protein n=1 Tax=Streptomyces sp. ME08-AFT2 TaxID=3028683 RepID=UPI0029B1F8C9|nr:winged helix-turn-helix domain-containing protein [Streptomyces sp. ME08-AFT2]MDX3313154.1 winged helix-turn-helix domain-containing protein [Streptomyces sp. ME08-AFT2]
MSGERQSSDGGGREFQRVADELRARLADGTYPARSFLPSQRQLAEEFQVSRDTVQRVLRELSDEGRIESRQGSGSRVLGDRSPRSPRPAVPQARMTLETLLDEGFDLPELFLDVYTLTAESLYAHIRVQAERLRARPTPTERIVVRMILPDEDLPLPYPRAKDDADDAQLRDRLNDITQRATASLRGLLRDLQAEEFVRSAELHIRHAPLTPAFKLYLLNGTSALQGPYQVIERRITLDSGVGIDALDVLGLGAALTGHVKDANFDSPGSVFVNSWQDWFDSIWEWLAS